LLGAGAYRLDHRDDTLVECNCVAVAEHALTSKTANHAVSASSPTSAKPEVTSAVFGDGKHRDTGGALQQLNVNVTDFQMTSTNTGAYTV